MKKFTQNPWVIGIGTCVIGTVISTSVVDWIKGIDWLSTLKVVIKFLANAVIAFLNFDIKVWWLLVFIGVGVLVLFVIAKIQDAKSIDDTPAFLSYTRDTVLGFAWEWEYTKTYEGKYTISNLHPVCSECGMILKQDGALRLGMKCLRCDKRLGEFLFDRCSNAH